jgi:NADPH-dependent glutamate synthase beta subunit-like oxidoreductase
VAAEPNPFPAICGRVCTAPCEDVCRRGEFDAPIAIRDLKRFATDHGAPGVRHIPKPKQLYSERVAIVGAGPTGLSAAYYLARRGYSVTVYDAMPVAGGMMSIGIPEYRLPRAELNRDIQAMRALGVVIVLNTAIGRDVELTALQNDFDAVLLAVGAQRSQRLDIPGEAELGGVTPATTFLKEYNLDPATQVDGVVAVIGGGSTAMDAARSALRAGATEVHIVYRRTQAEMPAQKEEVRAALAEGIQLHELAAPVQILGEGHVRALRCQRMTLSAPDEQERRRPIAMPDQDFELACDHVLVAFGEAPDPSFLPAGTSVEVGAWGGLLINPQTLATGAPGVFAAGDVTYGPKSIIHAAAHGRLAARSIHAFLRKLSPAAVSEMPDGDFMTVSLLPPDGAVSLDLRPQPREELPLAGSDAARDRSIEFVGGFSETQARREASRCLRCDLAYLCPTVHVVGESGEALAQASR